MSTTVTLNATSYAIPAVGENNWGTDVSAYLVALSTGVLTKAGGAFTLTADVDFGASYGLKSTYYKSRGTASSAGILRLANAESIGWRNAANSANLQLKVNSSNVLEYDGNPVLTLALGSADTVLRMNAGGTAYEWSKASLTANVSGVLPVANGGTNSSTALSNNRVIVSSGSAIVEAAAITASRALASDSNGIPVAVATTATELGYVNGVTSAIQTQIDGKQAADTDLTALAGLSSTGIIARTGSGSASVRTITGTTNKITVTDGDGVSGNPTLTVGSDIVQLTSTQQLTNKDIDGGTASNSLRITVPKNTTSNLSGLTRKQGTILYDTDLNVLKYDTGSTLNTLSTASTATADASGTITSFAPVVKSSINSVSSAGYTVLDGDGYKHIRITTGSSDRTVTLPTAADNTGRRITVKKIDSGTGKVIVDGEGSETVDGYTSLTLYNQYDFIELECNGTSWDVVNIVQTVAVYATSASNAASTSTAFVYGTEVADTAGAYNNSTGAFAAPVNGTYTISAGNYSGGSFAPCIYVDGVFKIQGTTATASTLGCVSATIALTAGQAVTIRPDASVTASGTATANWLTIAKVYQA